MVQIASYEDNKYRRHSREKENGHISWHTDFILPPEGELTAFAFLSESTPDRVLRTHYHNADEFQVVVRGGGTLGKHKLVPSAVHFARAYTPYGPLVSGKDGIAFLTLKSRKGNGISYFIPENTDKLKEVPDRHPWQAAQIPRFPSPSEGLSLQPLQDIRDEYGLAAYALAMKPDASGTAPDQSKSDGQYIVVLKGSLMHGGREYPGLTVVFVNAGEAPFHLQAGKQGLEGLVLNISRPELYAAKTPSQFSGEGFKTMHCELCSFTYDEAKGLPSEGIAPGTRWEDVPDSWTCPDCAVDKSAFKLLEF